MLLEVRQKIEKLLKEQVRRSFARQGFDGTRWKKLKKPKKVSKPLLVNTGKLKNSFTTRRKTKSVTIYSKVPYAVYHNEGTGKIPKRQMIGVTDKLKKDITKIFYEYFTETLKRTYNNNYRKR